MNTSNAVRAEILTQAVPYIKEYTGKLPSEYKKDYEE